MVEEINDYRNFTWKIDYRTLNSFISVPYILMGFKDIVYFIIGCSLFTIFKGSIVVKAKDGKTIHINLLTKPSALKNEVFELLSRHL